MAGSILRGDHAIAKNYSFSDPGKPYRTSSGICGLALDVRLMPRLRGLVTRGDPVTLIRAGGFHLNNYFCVTAHDYFLSGWLPFGRFRKRLHLAPLEIRLEVCCDLVLSRRDVAEGIGSVLFQG